MDATSATRSASDWEPSTHNHDPSHLAFARQCYAEGYAAGAEAALEFSPLRGTRMVPDEEGRHRRFVECWYGPGHGGFYLHAYDTKEEAIAAYRDKMEG